MYNIAMQNPFDRNFFHFLFGFIVILFMSFATIYFTSVYSDGQMQKDVAIVGKN